VEFPLQMREWVSQLKVGQEMPLFFFEETGFPAVSHA